MQGNTRTYWPALAAIGSAFWLVTACAPAAEDPDVSDAGPGPVVDAGGGGDTALQEDESCSVANSECDEGLLCLPSPLNPSVGVCRKDCGLRNDQGQVIDEDPSKCSDTRSCLVVLDPGSFDVTAVACLPQATQRDGTCLAPGDEEACAAPMQCHIAYRPNPDIPDDDPTSFNCKLTCDIEADDANDGCPGDEACFRSSLIQGIEPDATGQDVKTCTLASCEEDGTGCECTDGFECVQLIDSAEGQGGCVVVPGVCGIAQRGLTAADWEARDLQDSFCNDVDQHEICDNRGFDGLDNPGGNLCVGQGIFAPYTGICVGFCSIPSVDLNDDGVLSEDETGESFTCPTGQGCYTDWGRSVGWGPQPGEDGKTCNPANCAAGEPCPDECGPGDSECLTFEDESFCSAPFGNCEPLRDEPIVDAGVADDAGASTETDAGTTSDAGSDAGTTSDAGPDDTSDAGDDTGSTGGDDAGAATMTDTGGSTEGDSAGE